MASTVVFLAPRQAEVVQEAVREPGAKEVLMGAEAHA
jgi:hypothetical protein